MIFFFLLKTLFSFEIIIFLSWLFGYVEKRLDKRAMVIFKIYDVTENYAQKLVGFLVRTSLFLNVATFIKVHCIIVTFRKQPPEVFFKNRKTPVSRVSQSFWGLQIYFKKEILTQVFSCEFYDIFKDTFFYWTHPGDCFWLLTIWWSTFD